MFDVFVSTFYWDNYGSALQAFALQETIKKLGHNPCIIRQVNNDENRNRLYLILRTIKRFIWQFKPEKHYGLNKKIRMYFEKSIFEERNAKNKTFCENNIQFYDIDLANPVVPLDVESKWFIAGSDQIWNIIDRKISPIYLFTFLRHENANRYSYAASIGLETLTEDQLKYYEDTLSTFKSISLRETTACELLKRTNLRSKVRQDIDPTLLFDGDYWANVASDRLIKNRYIFVFMLRPNLELFDMARELAQKDGLSIVYTGLMKYKFDDVISRLDVGVEDFLSLIQNAEYVITNSFHGTCFATQFRKKFVSVKVESTGTRARDFLKSVGLEGRLIDGKEDISVIDTSIDYEEVGKRLNYMRLTSINYLSSIFNNLAGA